MRVPFTKMQGLGNDFVLLDERAAPLGLDAARLRRLADRRYGVGCDQVLIIDQPSVAGASVRYRVFNSDGSAAQHCGNGVRCVASYLAAHGAVQGDALRVEIAGSTFELKLADDGTVTVDMGAPDFEPAALPLCVSARAPRAISRTSTPRTRLPAMRSRRSAPCRTSPATTARRWAPACRACSAMARPLARWMPA